MEDAMQTPATAAIVKARTQCESQPRASTILSRIVNKIPWVRR